MVEVPVFRLSMDGLQELCKQLLQSRFFNYLILFFYQCTVKSFQ